MERLELFIHIFSELINLLERTGLLGEEFNYLPQREDKIVVDIQESFFQIKEAFSLLGLNKDQQESIFNLLGNKLVSPTNSLKLPFFI